MASANSSAVQLIFLLPRRNTASEAAIAAVIWPEGKLLSLSVCLPSISQYCWKMLPSCVYGRGRATSGLKQTFVTKAPMASASSIVVPYRRVLRKSISAIESRMRKIPPLPRSEMNERNGVKNHPAAT